MRDGFLNVLKPPGMTSHDVVGFVRRMLKLKKAGHAGTLDPGAAGVLPVAVGRATRLIEYLDEVDKSYRAELRFGLATDSGDDLGQVIERAEAFAPPGHEAILRAAQSLTGVITQVPPVYSAVKINGRRACDLMRQNIPVELPARQVTIYRLDILKEDADRLLIDVDCSKGTYIRSLCRDLGARLGIPAVMAFLLRRRVGDFRLEDACTPEELAHRGEDAVEPPERYLAHLERYDLPAARADAFCHGLPHHDSGFSGRGRLAVFGPAGFLGVGRFDPETSSLVPEKVYRTE
ncbi:MAG: tRNA pseudouridine(55) synthase TruB [Schwartzia sp.]|nr:tRNA pseudouridine(55) synthase TruB [Schwartzia sp. (in: firmicutes)]